MLSNEITVKYIGGATALLEVGGLRLLTDPTFDPKGFSYPDPSNSYTLYKQLSPAFALNTLGTVDFVLLSHDHHFDNLDHAGRRFLPQVRNVYTTPAGAERLGGNAVGIKSWQTIELSTKDDRILKITGTPCQHGPADSDRGPVTGFLLQLKGDDEGAVYISGDTVWYEGVKQVAERFDIRLVLLFMGAATVKEVGPDHLTMTAEEGVEVARHFDKALIMPLHYEGWAYFIESKAEIKIAFKKARLLNRLNWPE